MSGKSLVCSLQNAASLGPKAAQSDTHNECGVNAGFHARAVVSWEGGAAANTAPRELVFPRRVLATFHLTSHINTI